MKIAVASLGNTLESTVSPGFGRAPFFVFVDVENGEIKGWETIENPGYMAPRGAGIAAANAVVGRGAKAVVAGNFGPNAYTLLSQAGLAIYASPPIPVKEAAVKAEKGELPTGPVGPPGRWKGWRRRGWRGPNW